MLSKLRNMFAGSDPLEATAYDLYNNVVAQARLPVFYQRLGVPDDVDGRFEMIALHAFLLMRRLKIEDENARVLSQKLYDVMFLDMDRSIREMGVSDVSVGKHMKRMMRAFYGRIEAYELALGGASDLDEALRRNLYGTVKAVENNLIEMSAYVRLVDAELSDISLADLMRGRVGFAELN